MHQIAPPICFLLALLLLIGGFATLAREKPQPSMNLHRAFAEGDERAQEVYQAELTRKRWQRVVLITSLFGMAVLLTAIGFLAMQPKQTPYQSGPPDA